MATYVDNAKTHYGRMIMCHVIADTTDELLQMINKIGVDPRWIQYAGTYKEHFDVCQKKKLLAVQAGAIEITSRQLVKLLNERRGRCASGVMRGTVPSPSTKKGENNENVQVHRLSKQQAARRSKE